MSIQQASPKFSGYIRRLVEDGIVSASQMQTAVESSKKNKINLVAYLIEYLKLSPLVIA